MVSIPMSKSQISFLLSCKCRQLPDPRCGCGRRTCHQTGWCYGRYGINNRTSCGQHEAHLANDWKIVRITSDEKNPMEIGGLGNQ